MKKRKKLERIKKPKNHEQYMTWLTQRGYTTENGKPLKCEKCGCRKLEHFNYSYGDAWVEEFSVKCKSCNSTVGHWAYGYWQA